MTNKPMAQEIPVNESNEGTPLIQQSPMSAPDRSLPTLPPQSERYQEPEKVVLKKRRGIGCFRFLFNCRCLGCSGCLLIILLIAGFIFLIANKPTGIWGTFVNFMNAEIVEPQYEVVPEEQAIISINDQVTNVGENEVVITEQLLGSIVKGRFPQFKDMKVDIEQDIVKLVWKMDETVPETPLYGVIDITQNQQNKNLEITKVGTGRVGTPQFLNDAITGTITSFLNKLVPGQESNQILYNILSPEGGVTLSDVKIEKDQIKLKIAVSAKLL